MLCLRDTEGVCSVHVWLKASALQKHGLARNTLQEEWRVEVFPSGLASLHITSISHQPELDSVCISLSSGALLLIDSVTQTVEEVGSVEGGIMALEWSPDGDVLAVITGTGNLLIMSQEWEALEEVSLSDNAQGSDNADARITWRGDGKFFATSFKSVSGSRCVSMCLPDQNLSS